jgi:hypothetical protein
MPNEDVISKIRPIDEKKQIRIHPKDKNTMMTYEELGITPIHLFDYENYDKVNLF